MMGPRSGASSGPESAATVVGYQMPPCWPSKHQQHQCKLELADVGTIDSGVVLGHIEAPW